MASKATSSQGVQLKSGDGATPTEAFTALAEIKSFDGPSKTLADVDTTSMDSAAKESLPGLVDYGEIKVDGFFIGDDASQAQVSDDMDSRKTRNYKLVLADGDAAAVPAINPSQWAFKGYPKAFSVKGQTSGVNELSATIKITGKPTYTKRQAGS